VPFTLVYAEKYRTEEELKIQTIVQKLNTTRKKANNAKHSRITKLPWFSRLLWHSARKRGGLAYFTTLPSPGQL